jgi:hypothetical protein
MGPVDYLIVRFPGNKFNGKIIPELMDLEKKGIVRVLDLVLVVRDANGKVFVTEAKDLKGEVGEAFSELANNTHQWFFEGDIEELSRALPPESSAALLLWENTWARNFKENLIESEAEIIDMGRIPPERVAQVQKIMTQGGT